MESFEYVYQESSPSHTHLYLWPRIEAILASQIGICNRPTKMIFDLGCGNGAFLRRLHQIGFCGIGVDPSTTGVRLANLESSGIRVELGSAYEALSDKYGQFPFVISLEVVEHLYSPRVFARTLYDLVEPGGVAIVSTPYHGYIKNLAMAITGKLDSHFTVLWDHGHIKFWSIRTLTKLLTEAGFVDIQFDFAGRTKILAKSMIAVAKRPLDQGR